MADTTGWRPDVLGAGFEQRTLPLGSDDEGEVVATLVRHRPPFRLRIRPGLASGADVLYVHGWSDYFFNAELAKFWADAGARFFALDLRKYGRSIRPGQTPGYITDLDEYDEDLAAALAAMDSGNRPIILLGHSMGGLILSLWAARHHGRAAAVILNSPWLAFQASAIGREALSPIIGLQAKMDPRARLPSVDLGFYARSVSRELGGEWEYNSDWRPYRGFPMHPGWLATVLAGHARVADGIDVGAPTLVLLSTRSMFRRRWSPGMLSSDIVLVVEDVARRALQLGPEVSVGRIEGSIHDVFLSAHDPRAVAYERVTRWLRGYRPSR